ncbi:phosphatidylinositol-3-phosphatase ymr1 [Coemansia sp. Benny D115]|nr:phosphatidylinositol-3-phosphatase ymr1 [Coemansia sp. Benny D115]
MDLIRRTKVEGMRLRRGPDEYLGTLHLTTHHLIFTAAQVTDGRGAVNSSSMELWLGYPQIHSAVLQRPPKLAPRRDYQPVYTREELSIWALQGCIRIRCHHFLFLTLRCEDVRQLYDAYATMKHLSYVDSLEDLYAFSYKPQQRDAENKAAVDETEAAVDGWGLYDAKTEFERMGVGAAEAGRFWRFTAANAGFQLCSTYPADLVVPLRISDTTLTYAAKYRSKGRLPVLCYLHPNGASMTRSSQPMVGLKQARSVQDEKLVEAILASSEPQGVAPRFDYERSNIIIDARPTTNAVVNRAVGAGSENMDHYKRCRKVYLGIDNIHVMREALNKLVDAVAAESDSGRGVVARIQNSRSNWLRHIENIMVGVKTIVEAIAAGRHVVVHCSDGWDRTAQLTSLAQLCLDPYYRTARGFAVLVEKEWVSFGHQFTQRCGHLGHPDRFKVTRASATSSSAGNGGSDVPADVADSSEELVDASGSSAGGSVATPAEGDAGSNANAAESSGSGYEFLQTSTSLFGRFASRALKGVQSRISSAIQAASDNLDELEDPDPFFTEYPDLQPGFVPPAGSDTARARHSGGFRLGRSKHDHETSPVFQQFLDCVYQLWVRHPTMFEFNERFLLDLFYHLYSAQFGTMVGNNMRERTQLRFRERTQSVWSWMFRDKVFEESAYYNVLYMAEGMVDPDKQRVVVPDPSYLQYWTAMFLCHDPAFESEGENDDEEEEGYDDDEEAAAAAADTASSTSNANRVDSADKAEGDEGGSLAKDITIVQRPSNDEQPVLVAEPQESTLQSEPNSLLPRSELDLDPVIVTVKVPGAPASVGASESAVGSSASSNIVTTSLSSSPFENVWK